MQTKDTLNKLNKAIRPSSIPGIECPSCHGFIPISIKQIDISNKFICPECGFVFSMNDERLFLNIQK